MQLVLLFNILYLCVTSCSCWFSVLSRVHTASPEQLMEMHHEQANPKNAVVSNVLPQSGPFNDAAEVLITCKVFLFNHKKFKKFFFYPFTLFRAH